MGFGHPRGCWWYCFRRSCFQSHQGTTHQSSLELESGSDGFANEGVRWRASSFIQKLMFLRIEHFILLGLKRRHAETPDDFAAGVLKLGQLIGNARMLRTRAGLIQRIN